MIAEPLATVEPAAFAPTPEALFEQNQPLAEALARAYVRERKVQPAEHPEIHNVALIGLWEAARRWDASAGVPFTAFARARIHGAMLDTGRALSPGLLSFRRSGRTIPTLLRLHDRAPGDEDPTAPTPEPDQGARELLRCLPRRQRRVLLELVVYEIPLDVVALRVGLSRAQVSRLKDAALATLRRRLEGSN